MLVFGWKKLRTLCFTATLVTLASSSPAWSCEPSLKEYPFECEIQDRYRKVKDTFWNKYRVNVEFLSEYRATRLIDQSKWDKEKEKVDYCPWPVYEPAPSTWESWERGAGFVKQWVDRWFKEPLGEFKLGELERLHRAAISRDLIHFSSWILKGARPGVIRRPNFFQRKTPEFFIRCRDHSLRSKGYEVLANYDLKDFEGHPLVQINLASPCWGEHSGFYSGHVSYMSSRNVVRETENLLYLTSLRLNSYLTHTDPSREIDSTRVLWIPPEMKGYLDGSPTVSPIDFVADLQRRYISMHPFGEGNGRTSHFLQDLVLDSLGLPFAPTGRLTYELIYPTEEYRALTRKEILETVSRLEDCLKQYDSFHAGKGEISKACQPVCQYQKELHRTPTLACGPGGEILECEDLPKIRSENIAFADKEFKVYVGAENPRLGSVTWQRSQIAEDR